MRRILLAFWLACVAFSGSGEARENAPGIAAVAVDELPAEAIDTLQRIDRNGPFRHPRDGVVFGNYEHRLPHHARGYYHEYTVPTPGSRGRGARRIVAGTAGERYYSADHYRSFRKIRE